MNITLKALRVVDSSDTLERCECASKWLHLAYKSGHLDCTELLFHTNRLNRIYLIKEIENEQTN